MLGKPGNTRKRVAVVSRGQLAKHLRENVTEFKVGDIIKYEAVDDHATHGGPLNGLTEFAEYEVASVSGNSITLKNTDGTSLTYGNTGGGATTVD